MTPKLRRFLDQVRPSTPYLVVDVDVVEANYLTLAEAMDGVQIFYAVKANPAPEILARLAALGSSFDVASPAEVAMALAAGAEPARISYGNTIKKEADIARAFAMGVRLFAFDSEAELAKIARAAPGAKVFCRILTSGEGADWPLSKKFGCTPAMARDLLTRAADPGRRGLGRVVPCRLAAEGSRPPGRRRWPRPPACSAIWRRSASSSAWSISAAASRLPTAPRCRRRRPTASEIMAAVRRQFGNRLPFLIAEPGRGLVGNAGVIQTEVVLIADKGEATRGAGSISTSASSAASPRPWTRRSSTRSAATDPARPHR